MNSCENTVFSTDTARIIPITPPVSSITSEQNDNHWTNSISFCYWTASTMKVPSDSVSRSRVDTISKFQKSRLNFKTRFKNGLRKATIQFCMDSTMHGFKNICIGVQAPARTK